MSRQPRDLDGEAAVVLIAAQAVGLASGSGADVELHPTVAQLNAYAERRAWPGGVRTDAAWPVEAAEELADCRSYLIWEALRYREAAFAGDLDACEHYERAMRSLGYVLRAWGALTGSA